MARILVLGGGFGGITAALELRRRLHNEHDVTLIDQRDRFVMGLAHVWALDGRRPLERGSRPLEALAGRGIRVVRARVRRIDAAGRRVETDDAAYPYDYLVVALGAELAPDALEGFAAAHNLYDAADVPRLADAVAAFDGGRLLMAISSMPFKCPAAPYEAAMVLHAYLERRGVRSRTEIEITTPEPRPLPIAPASCSSDLVAHLKSRRIGLLLDHKPVAVRQDLRTVEYSNGDRRPYDLLIGVPPHRAPAVVREAGLADPSGWIRVDPRTLRTSRPEVFAVGDVALVETPSGKPLPKAGVFAEAEARVVAENLAAELSGGAPSAAFDGKGHCYVELGDGLATAVDGEFFAAPQPQVSLRMPTQEALREKEQFEAERLRAWFGA